MSDSVDAAEKEIYAERKFMREKRERLDKAFGSAWRIGFVSGIFLFLASIPFSAIRGCAAKPDVPDQCVESSIIYDKQFFESHSGYNGGDKCRLNARMSIHRDDTKYIVQCTCPASSVDGGTHE